MRPNLLLLSLILSFCACSSRIQHGLDERQANEIATVLEERGVKASKVPEPGKKPTWALEVDTDQATDAIRILAELGLPRPATGGFGEVYGKGSLVPSASEERALYLQALSGEIARTLESVDGVVSARVHLVLPQPLRAGQTAAATEGAKAAAFVKVRPGHGAKVQAARAELRSMIASSVEGLSPDAVTLMVTEVSSAVEVRVAPSRLGRMRALLIVMGALTSILGLGVVGLALRLKALPGKPATVPVPPSPLPQPVPSLPRKVA